MSLYEVLAIVALAGVGGFAYYLYRSDMRSKPQGQRAPDGTPAPEQLMFGRDRSGSSKKPEA